MRKSKLPLRWWNRLGQTASPSFDSLVTCCGMNSFTFHLKLGKKRNKWESCNKDNRNKTSSENNFMEHWKPISDQSVSRTICQDRQPARQIGRQQIPVDRQKEFLHLHLHFTLVSVGGYVKFGSFPKTISQVSVSRWGIQVLFQVHPLNRWD